MLKLGIDEEDVSPIVTQSHCHQVSQGTQVNKTPPSSPKLQQPQQQKHHINPSQLLAQLQSPAQVIMLIWLRLCIFIEIK